MNKKYSSVINLVMDCLFVAFCCLGFFPASAQSDTNVAGRYLRIELPGENRTLSLAEIEVIYNNRYLAQAGKAKQSSDFRDATASKAIDGNTSGNYYLNSVSGTQPENSPWWELDLRSDQVVDKIIVYNRTDCCIERINPARITFYNSSRVVVWQGEIKTDAASYIFDIHPNALIHGNNLLTNASFNQSSNQLLPDYWDLHHAAALGLKDLYGAYGIDPAEESPVNGTSVVSIENYNNKFHNMILMPMRQERKLADGNYTFSVYVKSKNNGKIMNVTSGWAIGKPQRFNLTNEWKRYSVTFDVHGSDVINLQPVMFFPDTGKYFIAAPQLEYSSQATQFNDSSMSSSEDVYSTLKSSIRMFISKAKDIFNDSRVDMVSFLFEYNYYTNEKSANIFIQLKQFSNQKNRVQCLNTADSVHKNSIFDAGLINGQATISVPIDALPTGVYRCDLYSSSKNGKDKNIASAILRKMPVSQFEVKLNNIRKYILVDGTPYFVTGVAVGYVDDLPEWYLDDIKKHGVNTIFLNVITDSSGHYDISGIESFISKIGSYDLHAIIGLPLAGDKPLDWNKKLVNFLKIVSELRDNNIIIGWYPIDEPAANKWSEQEIEYIYSSVKKADPYRLVFLNWAYDGIPASSGTEPIGGLKSTDVYSFDYYPFTGKKMSLEGYSDMLIRVQDTAHKKNKIAHSWIQIYGGNNAWREPTPQELRYMVYLNLVQGSMFSYWDTKSNSVLVWSELSQLNKEADILAKTIFMNPNANRVALSVTDTGVAYSIWVLKNKAYIIVVNTTDSKQKMEIDIGRPFSIVSNVIIPRIASKNILKVVNSSFLQDEIQPYAGQVYELDL